MEEIGGWGLDREGEWGMCGVGELGGGACHRTMGGGKDSCCKRGADMRGCVMG